MPNLVPLVVKWDVPHCAIVSSTFISCGNKTIDRMKSLISVYSLHFTYVPETDTMFGGVSAFPGSSIVTGLKYKKYKGYTTESPWSKYF
jgi:hypothetical protein